MKIYVGNMSYDTTEEDLHLAFKPFGKAISAAIIKDKLSGRTKGFAFVEMSSDAEGQAAIAGLNGKELKGRELNVNEPVLAPRVSEEGVQVDLVATREVLEVVEVVKGNLAVAGDLMVETKEAVARVAMAVVVKKDLPEAEEDGEGNKL